MSDVLIRYDKYLFEIDRGKTDMTAVPPDASLIYAADWKQMIADAGSEEKLIDGLELEDLRDVT